MGIERLMDVFRMSMEISDYIKNMADLMDGEKSILVNEHEIAKGINQLNSFENEFKEIKNFEGIKVLFSTGLLENLNATINRLHDLYKKTALYYKYNDIEGLIRVSNVYKELNEASE